MACEKKRERKKRRKKTTTERYKSKVSEQLDQEAVS